MNNKKGEIYFRDIHGNFHKLETKELDDEILELTGYDNILHSNNFEKEICNYKPYNYYKLILENVKNGNTNNNKVKLEKGIYKFSVYMSITSNIKQRIYFFLRNHKIISSTFINIWIS